MDYTRELWQVNDSMNMDERTADTGYEKAPGGASFGGLARLFGGFVLRGWRWYQRAQGYVEIRQEPIQ